MKNFFNKKLVHKNNNLVERGMNEIRRGMPLIIYYDNSYLLVSSSELLSEGLLNNYKSFGKEVCIILTYNRVISLLRQSCSGQNLLGRQDSFRFFFEQIDLSSLASLVLGDNFFVQYENLKPACLLDNYAITIMKMLKLLPSAVVVDLEFSDEHEMISWSNKNDIMAVPVASIKDYQACLQTYEVCRSDLFLKDSENSKIIVYRSNNSIFESYALIIGSPDYNEPMVRIHSSCYTGDLLASLSCDCRDQLHNTIKKMADCGGGVIIYLPQDGRNIGLVNKIRTYEKQIHYGLDTVEANRFFGFEDDERTFGTVASILKNLGIINLKLLTNNPNKVKEIEKYAICVKEVIPILTRCNQYNNNYLKTKVERLGHTLNCF